MPKLPDAIRWLDYADTDLRSALMLVKDADLARNAGFFAQQAAEKSLKAILASSDETVPKTHDLGVLADLVEPAIEEIAECRKNLEWLAIFAVDSRYPVSAGLIITQAEAQKAIRIAEHIKEICLYHLKSH